MHKAQEERISDALDENRILNVSVAEAPTIPSLPAKPNWPWSMALGGLLASLASVGLGFASDYFDPSLRTPDELERVLDLPVIAALPEDGGE
jgi:capsular polysaccharide biosynthesis protein